MKVTEKCDIYSFGVVLLELLTGKTPVQQIDQGGDLATWTRNHIRDHSLTCEILDPYLTKVEDDVILAHMITVTKIAVLCTKASPSDRPTMREVVLMLIESGERAGKVIVSATCGDLPPPVQSC